MFYSYTTNDTFTALSAGTMTLYVLWMTCHAYTTNDMYAPYTTHDTYILSLFLIRHF